MARDKCKMGLGSFVSVCHSKRGLGTIFCIHGSMFAVQRTCARKGGGVVQHGALYRRDFTTINERTHDGTGDAMIANEGGGTRVLGLGARTRWPVAWRCD